MSRRSIAVIAMALGMLLLASVARADTANVLEPQSTPPGAEDGLQAGPCTVDTPTTKCSPQTPGQFFKQAGGHPPRAFVQFIVRHFVNVPNQREPLVEPIEPRVARTVRVDLPPGLSVNPQATPKCSLADFFHETGGKEMVPLCQPNTKIGESRVSIVTTDLNVGDLTLPLGARFEFFPETLFNLEPKFGEPALFGFVVGQSIRIFLRPEISWESDFHESFTIEELPDVNTIRPPFLAFQLAAIAIHTGRLISFGTAGDGTLATNPTTCFNPDEAPFAHIYSSWIRVDSHGEPNPSFPFGTTPFEGVLPPGTHPEGCGTIPFAPSIELTPGVDEVDSPASPTVAVKLPVQVPSAGGDPLAESHLRAATVKLPEGMGLNPAGSAGLLACPDADFHKGERIATNDCPAESVVGTAEIRTPVLPQPLLGNVYVGEPKSTDPASGEEFRIFVEAKSDEASVAVRLIGGVKADPKTGQLTATFDEQEISPLFGMLPHGLPQVPFESFTLKFDGAHKILSTPPTCSTAATTSELEPWARPGTHASPSAQFTLLSLPGGGQCPQTLAQRPFEPAYAANPDKSKAGAFSPFRIHIGRPAGQQEIKMIDTALPKGLLGKLARIPYCPEEAIAAATGRSGAAEQEASSCSEASLVGTTSTESGTGASPLKLPGNVYLAGPYKGAPLSLVSITPAVSGPFDLGTVVIRVALNLDPATAQISAVSDRIPDVFGGVRLGIRAIDFNLDRNRFTVNPTNCSAQRTNTTLSGGGADPSDPTAFSSHLVTTRFQPTGCEGLSFTPRLTTTLSGPTKRNGYPALTTKLEAFRTDANLAGVSLTLPHAFFVAQEHIATVCTRPQLASQSCPASSIYGEAEASSPLLSGKLAGPVYLVPGGNELPDLVVDLRGQVHIQLHGVISVEHGKIRTAFDATPDVPVGEFVLRLAGGKKGLLVNSANICKGRLRAALNITAQNGLQVNEGRYKLNIAGCGKQKKHKKKHKKHPQKRH